MRAAGCAYNDYVDRDIDAQVARTASRPIPSGQVTPARGDLLHHAMRAHRPRRSAQFQYLHNCAVHLVSVARRALSVCQAHHALSRSLCLGLVFNWGALAGWAAVKGSLDWPPLLLYIGCVLWTIGYDTIYAHQDKEDDALLGLGSTALLFGENTVSIVGALYLSAAVFWLAAGALAGAHLIFFLAVTLVFLQMAWQVATLDTNDPANCLWRFRSNRDVGAAVFLGLVADMALSWFAGLS